MSFNPELCRNESEVESKLIVSYLLPKLGYTPDSWHQEVAFGNIRLDFLSFATQVIPIVIDADSPLSVVIEAKHPNQKLDRHVRRLKRYLTSLSIRYGLITNAKEIRIYEIVSNDVKLVFNCLGKDVDVRIDEIRGLIGKDSLKKRRNDNLPNNDLTITKIISDYPISLEVATQQNNSISAESESYPISEELLLPQTNTINTQVSDYQLSELKKEPNMKVIAVYHNKGGVGKTTTVVNLAAALRKKNYRVLIVDLDSQANTTFATGLIKFQFEEDDNIKDNYVYHLIESGEFNFIPNLVRKSEFFNNPEIDVIPSHINLAGKEDQLNKIAASRTRLVTKLKRVENDYDIVIIDTPPSRDLYAEIALIAADYLIIPSDLKPFANQGLSNVKNFIKQINEYREVISKVPLKIMGVLPSKISTNAQFLKHTFARQKSVITERYHVPLMESIIFERAALSHCLNQNIAVGELEIPNPKSIFNYEEENTSASSAAGDFEALAVEVLKKMEKV